MDAMFFFQSKGWFWRGKNGCIVTFGIASGRGSHSEKAVPYR